MMKSIGLFEAKTKLSEICQKVAETGEVYTITKRGRPVVKITPFKSETEDFQEFKHLSIWEARKAYEAKYGSIEEDLELPERKVDLKRKDPLDE